LIKKVYRHVQNRCRCGLAEDYSSSQFTVDNRRFSSLGRKKDSENGDRGGFFSALCGNIQAGRLFMPDHSDRIANAAGAALRTDAHALRYCVQGRSVNGDCLSRQLLSDRNGVHSAGVDRRRVCSVTASTPSFDRLREIRSTVDVPRVLRGSLVLSGREFIRSAASGISKVNIFIDLRMAGMAAQAEAPWKKMDYLKARNMRIDTIHDAAEKKMDFFGGAGRSGEIRLCA